MKKKILASLIILTFFLIGGGIYITQSNNKVISELENIISLHRVEHLRKNLLNQVEIVQADLLLKDSPHARIVDIFVQHIEEMESAANICSTCHFEGKVKERINHFQGEVDKYIKKLSRVYTVRANEKRLIREREQAFEAGQHVIEEINKLVIQLDEKISTRISQASTRIVRTKQFLTFFLCLSPFIVFGLAFFFLRSYTTSVATLIGATRKLKEGDLHYRIEENLKDEFQELGNAFNKMASSLKAQCVRMQHAERLAVIGELAAGLAHEVRNPLTGIKISIEVLTNKLSLAQGDKNVFLQIVHEINRIESLLKELLSYARPAQPRLVSLDIHQVLEMPLRNAQYSLKKPGKGERHVKDIQFIQEVSPDVPKIVADPGQLQQVFLNLIMNAIDAIDTKGTITVKTSYLTDGFVQIVISDTGKGMDSETLSKIFVPFFTTKPKGTGLGLSICKRLIEQHDGTIEATSNPDGGISFTMRLPVRDQQSLENITS